MASSLRGDLTCNRAAARLQLKARRGVTPCVASPA
jgi:hypothetical protein